MDSKILKKMIEIESLSGQEKYIIEEIKNIAVNLKIKYYRQEENIVFYIKGESDQRALILNGHVDTVSAGKLENWNYRPFGQPITIKDGKIYGLGSSDMKGGIYALIETAKWFNKHVPPVDLWFSFVVREELDGSGTKSFIKWFKKQRWINYKEIACIIAEPSGLKEIVIGHKGNYFIKITTFGNSGHGAYPERLHEHAVLEMYHVIKEMQKLEKKWQKKYAHLIIGKPTIGLTTSIAAGDIDSPNKFPDQCIASFDIRTTPGLHTETLKELKDHFKKIHCTIELICESSSYSYTDPNERIVKVFQSILKEIPLTITQGASDQCFFTEAEIPAVVFGPGEKESILMANEFCYLSKIERSIEIYKRIINKF